MASHSSILAWRILWVEEPGGLLSMGLHRVGHDWSDFACMLACIGEVNGSPVQCSCLENPTDREVWQATVHRIAQCQTWLKRLSMQAHGISCYSSIKVLSGTATSLLPWGRNPIRFTLKAVNRPQGLASQWPVTSVPCHMGFPSGSSQLGGRLPWEHWRW